MMLPNLPIPVERVVTPPKCESIQKEDEKSEQRVEESRKASPKESFDTHLHRVLPPGWTSTPLTSPEPSMLDSFPSLVVGGFKKPMWLQKALGELALDDSFMNVARPVVLQVQNAAPLYEAHQILSAVKDGAPIHEAHFPHLFAAQVVQMQQQGEPISRLMVQIAPEHLGRLNLTFTLQQQTVTVSVLAANQQAKDMLERQLGAISNILSTHHFKPGDLKVEVAHSSGGSNSRQFSGEGESAYQTPNRWLIKRHDPEEELDVALG